MMNQENFVKKKILSGKTVLGIWSIINSPMLSEVNASAGLDFQILDMEHGVFDLPSLEAGIRACESAGCSPWVRVAGLHPSSIQSVLDLGAHGVIVPQIQGYDAALEAVRATKFAPSGTRGFNPFTRAGNYRGGAAPRLLNSFGMTSIIIENKRSFEQLDQILTIPDLDMLYLGVYDMSVALGCMGELTHPSIVSFLESAIPRIRAAGKAVGVMVKNKAEMEHFLKMGANFLVYGVDTFVVNRAISEGVADFLSLNKA